MSFVDLLPPLVVGTARIGSPILGWSWDQRRVFRYLDAVTDLGLRAFDLAASYQMGGTERLFGAWLAGRQRDRRLPAYGVHLVRPRRVVPLDEGLQLQRHRRHRQLLR